MLFSSSAAAAIFVGGKTVYRWMTDSRCVSSIGFGFWRNFDHPISRFSGRQWELSRNCKKIWLSIKERIVPVWWLKMTVETWRVGLKMVVGRASSRAYRFKRVVSKPDSLCILSGQTEKFKTGPCTRVDVPGWVGPLCLRLILLNLACFVEFCRILSYFFSKKNAAHKSRLRARAVFFLGFGPARPTTIFMLV